MEQFDWYSRLTGQVVCSKVKPAWEGAWDTIRFPAFHPPKDNEVYTKVNGRETFVGLREVRVRGFKPWRESISKEQANKFTLSPTTEMFLLNVVPQKHQHHVDSIRRRVEFIGCMIDGPIWVGTIEDKPASPMDKVDENLVSTIEARVGKPYPKWARLFAQTSDFTDLQSWAGAQQTIAEMGLVPEVQRMAEQMVFNDTIKLQQWWSRVLPQVWRCIAREHERR